MYAIQVYQPIESTPDLHIVTRTNNDHLYRAFYDYAAADQAVIDHCNTLPSASSDEQHTLKNYTAGVKMWKQYLGDRFPSKAVMTSYIAYLKKPKSAGGRGLSSVTVATKYLAPVRHWLQALKDQDSPFGDVTELRSGTEFLLRQEDQRLWDESQRMLDQALRVKNPRTEETTNIAPLWDPKFKRLTHTQVNAVLRDCNRNTLVGARDYAFLLLAFSSALRIDELRRVTLNKITAGDGAMLITVKGKRNNMTPVGVGEDVVEAIEQYVALHNAGLDESDVRRITPDTRIWQPYMHNGSYCQIGYNKYCADGTNTGISIEALRGIIAKRTRTTLGPRYELAAHDTRRTAAAIAYDAGMPITEIQALLRHKNPGQTLAYIGQKPTYKERNLSNYVTFG